MENYKFRLWNRTEKEMFLYDHIRSWSISNLNVLRTSNEIFMQFVGKKDKELVEIYEDDIIADLEGNLGIVKFDEYGCQFIIDFGEGYEYQIIDDWCLVVGNIHQNPELKIS